MPISFEFITVISLFKCLKDAFKLLMDLMLVSSKRVISSAVVRSDLSEVTINTEWPALG